MNQPLIELELKGDGATPGNITNRDLAVILNRVQEMVEAVIAEEQPNFLRKKFFLGLVNIRDGSAGLQFASSDPDVALSAFQKIGSSIERMDFGEIPPIAVNALKSFRNITYRHHWEMNFVSVVKKREVLATINRDTLIQTVPTIEGQTTIYGNLIKLGGHTPKVLLEMASGRGINCDFRGGLPLRRQFVQELAPRIYSWIGLEGTASWATKDYRLREFVIERVIEFRQESLTSSFQEMSSLIGQYFDGVDPEAYVSDVRGDE